MLYTSISPYPDEIGKRLASDPTALALALCQIADEQPDPNKIIDAIGAADTDELSAFCLTLTTAIAARKKTPGALTFHVGTTPKQIADHLAIDADDLAVMLTALARNPPDLNDLCDFLDDDTSPERDIEAVRDFCREIIKFTDHWTEPKE